MTGLLIAVFGGWLGAYRFYKKQIGMGVLYLLTFGLFGVGWIIDIVTAYKEMKRPSYSGTPALMTVQIKGAFAECNKDASRKRVEIIQRMNVGDRVLLETAFYEGTPFYLAVDANTGLDIGALPSELNKYLKLNNVDPGRMSAILTKRDLDNPEIQLTIN